MQEPGDAASTGVDPRIVSLEAKRLGDRLGAELTRARISRAELGRQVGIHPSVVTRYIDGHVNVPYTTLTRIAAVLGITTAQLVGDGQLDGELAS